MVFKNEGLDEEFSRSKKVQSPTYTAAVELLRSVSKWEIVKVFLLQERDPLFRSYHFRQRNLGRPRKGKGHYGMASAKNSHEVRSVMGLASYYQRFVEWFFKIVKPITSL